MWVYMSGHSNVVVLLCVGIFVLVIPIKQFCCVGYICSGHSNAVVLLFVGIFVCGHSFAAVLLCGGIFVLVIPMQ